MKKGFIVVIRLRITFHFAQTAGQNYFHLVSLLHLSLTSQFCQSKEKLNLHLRFSVF